MNDLEYISISADLYFYVKWKVVWDVIIIALYVDGLLLVGNNISAVGWMKAQHFDGFVVKDLGSKAVLKPAKVSNDRKT